ncbi:MAG TPA: dephospho-CoA kinase [Pirellulales bacterium]|nr:dephospho-CoA kinase [Pirellulales bacterium]
MKVVGLLGGVASGKSLVARQLCDLGAGLLDGDRAGHEALRLPEVQRLVKERWGEAVFAADGQVDRRALARIVFAPPPGGPCELEHLERITHPRITQSLRDQIAALAAEGRPAAVLDAPVMLKAGWHEFCHFIVFVDVSKEVRQVRSQQRGWSQEDFAAREAAQESLDVKRRLADTIVDNSGSPEATRAQVERLWRSLVG